MPIVLGSQLPLKTQQRILSGFVYRWTSDNPNRRISYGLCPVGGKQCNYQNSKSANGHNHPTIPLINDAEWLTKTTFHVRKNYELDERYNHAHHTRLIESG